MPLADKGRFVPGLLQEFEESDVPVIPWSEIVLHPVPVRVLPGKKAGPGRAAEGGGHKGIVETDSFLG